MESEIKGLVKISLWTATSLIYARIASSHINPGNHRFLFLLPVLFIFCHLPSYLSFISFKCIAIFNLTWLGISRLLLLSFGSGPLSPSLPLHTFISYAILPIKIRPVKKAQSSSLSFGYKLIIFVAKSALFVSIIYLLRFKDQMHHYVLHLLHLMFMYLLVDINFNSIFSALAKFAIPPGFELVPFLEAPLCSTSLQEFWGQRWNIIVSDVLRSTIYNPVRSRHGAVVGTIAAFLVSGLIHEFIFYNVGGLPPTMEITAFFVVNGVAVVTEKAARSAGWWRPPKAIAVVVTLGFVAVTSFWLFFAPMTRYQFEQVWINECKKMTEFVQSARYSFLSKVIV